ncbi:MAG: phosphopyruvate hydratase [Patescibacteria group bacterium]
MSKITKIEAREILDSRGNPTLEVDTYLEGASTGEFGRFSVPSGASTGKYEALEKRDGDMEHFAGLGEKKVAERIENEIAPLLYGKDFDQRTLDNFLIEKDGTENKSNFGANSILGISMSFAKAESLKLGVPFFRHIAQISNNKTSMPIPMLNIINGGRHADSGLDIQEFMIVPLWPKPFFEILEDCDEIFMHLKSILEEKGLSTEVGDEGGFAPKIGSHRQALDFIMQAIEKAGFKPDADFGIALDAASSEFYKDGKYILKSENKEFTSSELADYYKNLIKDYPIVSIEDPFSEDDWEASSSFTREFGDDIMIVGDDLFVTNMKKLEEGIEKKAANSILIKLNQVGSLSETLDVIARAKDAHWSTIISHRSGETEDTSISHLAVGTNAGHIKTGSLSRSERTAKYNELLRIEEELNNQ